MSKIVENYNNTVNFENEGFINFFDLKLTFFLFPCITVPV